MIVGGMPAEGKGKFSYKIVLYLLDMNVNGILYWAPLNHEIRGYDI